MLKIVFASIMIMGGWTNLAASQTAEETVALLMSGLEDGFSGDSGYGSSGPFVTKMESTSPAVFDILSDGKSVNRFEVSKIDDCKYLMKSNLSVDVTIDFNESMIGDEVKDEKMAGIFNEKFMCGPDGKCFGQAGIAVYENPERRIEAAKYMKENFCEGGKF